MLMKHGVKAKIDIKEAKKYFKENTWERKITKAQQLV
jgi:hypothetical protein